MGRTDYYKAWRALHPDKAERHNANKRAKRLEARIAKAKAKLAALKALRIGNRKRAVLPEAVGEGLTNPTSEQVEGTAVDTQAVAPDVGRGEPASPIEVVPKA